MPEPVADDPGRLEVSGDEQDALAAAYERQTAQTHEARAALAQAVHELRLELEHRRGEAYRLGADVARLVTENAGLSEQAQSLSDELRRLQARTQALEHELQIVGDLLTVFRNMKVVRWTVWPRRVAYRLLGRGG